VVICRVSRWSLKPFLVGLGRYMLIRS